MSGAAKEGPSTSTQPRSQWPYKHLWNILRGESILADDEVILEELRLSFEHIYKGLTQYPPRKEDAAEKSTTSKTDSSEKKLRERISQYLNLEEKIAWDLFCSYMMFEYRGGSTSFVKLLEAPRVSTDLLSDLRFYYMNERTTVLLCLQGLFGHLGDPAHKYNHIFKAFSEWADENGTSDLTLNLVKSLECAKNENEEISVLHALVLLTYELPHLAVKPFCKWFKGFKQGRKGEKLLQAEAALMYSVLLVPGFDELGDFPEQLMPTIEEFLVEHTGAIVMNKYSVGAVVAAWVSSCPQNMNVQRMITTTPYPGAQCVSSMTELAKVYAKNSIGHRHNLPTAVLKGLYAAVETIYEKLDSACPKFGSKTSFLDFLVAVLGHSGIATRLLSLKPDLLDLITGAIMKFPLDLQYMLGLWGSMCVAEDSSSECLTMLNDCMNLLTSVSEYSSDPVFMYSSNASKTGYQNPKDRIVAGVLVPAGTEVGFVTPEDESGNCIVTWDLKMPLPKCPWAIIYDQILAPIIDELCVGISGSCFGEATVAWKWIDYPNGNVNSLLKFLLEYASVATEITPELHELYEPMAYLMLRSYEHYIDMKRKSIVISNIVALINASNKFSYLPWVLQYQDTVWPNSNEQQCLVENIIMGYESVANNDCKVTIGFLTSVLQLFHDDPAYLVYLNPAFKNICFNSVKFINDNVFHSFTRWRVESQEVKFKVLLNCLKVYNCVFSVDDDKWFSLKDKCAHSLLQGNSSLMVALGTDEEQLQLAVINPNQDIYLLPDIIYESLALLLKLFEFQKQSIKTVDTSLGLTLVQKLGRFARHRLDYKIPTLAMSLLKKIAEEIKMSLLSCFGSDEVAFRDLILQRLEFRSEDVNLKASILEFLTVAAHTQPGLIQYIFMDDCVAEKIIDLPTEKDEGLALSVLMFIRAMFEKGATVMKKCKNLWENVFLPIKLLQAGGRMNIITATLNIASIELYQFGLSDPKFAAEVKPLLKEVEFVRIMEIALSDKDTNGPAVKCLHALKHFISVVLVRNDLDDVFSDSTRLSLLKMVSDRFWNDKDEQTSEPKFATVIAELMLQLASSIPDTNSYFITFSVQMSRSFYDDCIPVQTALLSLMNECIKKLNREVNLDTVENIVRVFTRVLSNCTVIFENGDLSTTYSILTLAAAITCSVIKSEFLPKWVKFFDFHTVAVHIVNVANIGITKLRGPEIVIECLQVMSLMASHPKVSKMLLYSSISQRIWTPAIRCANEKNEEENQWDRVYLMCLQLATQMLHSQKFYALEDCFSFWGLHGTILMHKLWSFYSIASCCVLTNPEANFKIMKNLLSFNIFILDFVSAMVPYYSKWTMYHPEGHSAVIKGVFMALKTALNFDQNPQYLHSLMGFSRTDNRLSPQVVEVHSKLWDIIYMGVHIYWRLRRNTHTYFSSEEVLTTVNQVAQACLKLMTSKGSSHSDRRSSHTMGHHASPRIEPTMEISMCLFNWHASQIYIKRKGNKKQQQNFIREIASDIGTLCDGIKRLSGPKNELLIQVCRELESGFKEDQEWDLKKFNLSENKRKHEFRRRIFEVANESPKLYSPTALSHQFNVADNEIERVGQIVESLGSIGINPGPSTSHQQNKSSAPVPKFLSRDPGELSIVRYDGQTVVRALDNTSNVFLPEVKTVEEESYEEAYVDADNNNDYVDEFGFDQVDALACAALIVGNSLKNNEWSPLPSFSSSDVAKRTPETSHENLLKRLNELTNSKNI